MPLFHWDEETKKLEKAITCGGWVGYTTEPLEDDHPLQRAVTIGQKVLELAPEGSELHKVESVPICCWPGARINILFVPPEPLKGLDLKPLRGLAWLQSLPMGARIRCGQNGYKWFIIHGGMQRVDYHTRQIFFATTPTTDIPWVQHANPETCPEWGPND